MAPRESITVCALMVALSIYLSTSFLLAMAGEWFSDHFGFIGNLRQRFVSMRSRKVERKAYVAENAASRDARMDDRRDVQPERTTQATPEQRMIIGDQHPDRLQALVRRLPPCWLLSRSHRPVARRAHLVASLSDHCPHTPHRQPG